MKSQRYMLVGALAVGTALVVAAVLSAFFLFRDGEDPMETVTGLLVDPHKTVVELLNDAGTARAANVGDELEPRQTLSTNEDGLATGLLPDRGICGFENGARAQMLPTGTTGPVFFEQFAGAATCIVFMDAQAEVRTALGVFRPQGTSFKATYAPGEPFSVVVYQGSGILVSFLDGEEPMPIQEGDMASIRPDGTIMPPGSAPLTPKEVDRLRELVQAIENPNRNIKTALGRFLFVHPLLDNRSLTLKVTFGFEPEEIAVGTTVRFTAVHFSEASYEWDFGDGTPVTGGRITTHVYDEEGTFPVAVTVTTVEGLEGDSELTIVVDAEPVAPAPTSTVAPPPPASPPPATPASPPAPTPTPTATPTPEAFPLPTDTPPPLGTPTAPPPTSPPPPGITPAPPTPTPTTIPIACNGMTFDQVIIGTAGADVIFVSGGRALIFGLGGNDVITSGNRSDCIAGGPGNDTIFGNNGRDVLVGGAGNDMIEGGNGMDQLLGGAGNDTLTGDNSDDLVDGGPGNDLCSGGRAPDVVVNCERFSAAASHGNPAHIRRSPTSGTMYAILNPLEEAYRWATSWTLARRSSSTT